MDTNHGEEAVEIGIAFDAADDGDGTVDDADAERNEIGDDEVVVGRSESQPRCVRQGPARQRIDVAAPSPRYRRCT